MSQIFTNTGPTISERDIEVTEDAIGVRLPPKYRRFLQAQNGGKPGKRWFTIPGHHDGWDQLDHLCGIGHNTLYMNLAYALEFPSYLQHGIVPIGGTSTSGLVCLDLTSQTGEQIVYMDVADPLDQQGMKRRYVVAEDVFAFCEKLVDSPS